MLRVLVQARMSSSRFPGKVLAPFLGKPIIAHVIERIQIAVPSDQIILLTSSEMSDDPLAAYVERQLGITVYRGELENVFARFQGCLREHPCDWFARICADSPMIDGELIARLVGLVRDDFDIVTNVSTRTFPPGQSVELMRTAPFLSVDSRTLTTQEQEHVTLPYYRKTSPYRMLKVVSSMPSLANTPMAVDSIEDLRKLEAFATNSPTAAISYADLATIQR